ncbi:MAG TPA: putative sulfate exporter family transporter [Steroidobacteraceae bacterium]
MDTTRIRSLGSGLAIAVLVALAASWLAEHYSSPVMLFALLLGIAVNFLSQDPRCRPGIDFASRSVLRVGVALLGARITLAQVESLGGGALVLAATAVVLTIACGVLLARSARLPSSFGVLTGGSVAICGASAALAIASVLPRHPGHERDTVMTVVAVTALSTVAMILYPVLAAAIGLGEHTAGVFLGATIHDVAQVVGAGYSVSTVAGDTATIVKLFRVAMLLPVVLVVSFLVQRSGAASPDGEPRPPLLPMFLVGFAALVAVNSAGWLAQPVAHGLQEASRWCLVTAIAALGTKTSLGDLARVGWKPVAIIVGETLFVGAFVLAGLLLLR